MKKYKPIKVFSLHYGHGWWWGRYIYFFKSCFAIVPISRHYAWTDLPKEWYGLIDNEKYSWKFMERL